MGVDEVLMLTKDDLLTLSCKDDSSDVSHLSKVDVGRIGILLHFKNSEQV